MEFLYSNLFFWRTTLTNLFLLLCQCVAVLRSRDGVGDRDGGGRGLGGAEGELPHPVEQDMQRLRQVLPPHRQLHLPRPHRCHRPRPPRLPQRLFPLPPKPLISPPPPTTTRRRVSRHVACFRRRIYHPCVIE